MHRRAIGILILTVSLDLLLGCVGSNQGGNAAVSVQHVNLSPSGTQSIDIGATQVYTAIATDAFGRAVVAGTIQFTVSSPPGSSSPPPLSFLAGGIACAGTWDSTGTVCLPGSPGIALVTATAGGVSSAQTTVYVHQHISNIQVSRLDPQGPPQHDCFSQGQSWGYQAIAYDVNHNDITGSVGPPTWTSSSANVVTTTPVVSTGQPNVQNQVQVTAKTPGITDLSASISGISSTPMPFTTCLVKYIRLQIQNGSGNTFNIASGSTTISATVVDTLDTTLSAPPLTWMSSNPESASFSSPTNTTGSNSITARANAGGTALSAACTPPTCNIGVLPGLPVYASGGNLPVEGLPIGQPAFGVISASVTPTKEPTFSAWAATTQCNNGLNCQSYAFVVTPGTNPVGASALLPRTPNSMMFNPQGARIYFGSDLGLMFLDVGGSSAGVTEVSAASTPCHVSLCGKVLAISPDGNRVVVSDNISNPHQVYIYNASTSTGPIDLVLSCPASLGPNCTPSATAATFSPDEMKVFILGVATDQNGNLSNFMSVYSSVDALQTIALSNPAAPSSFVPASDVTFSADGSFAVMAGTPANAVSAFATCNLADLGNLPLTATPIKIFSAPDIVPTNTDPTVTQTMVVLAPPVIQTFAVNFIQNDVLDGQFTCNAPTVNFLLPPPPAINLGQGTFSPLYMRITGNGSGAVVVANLVPAVLIVDLNQQTTTAIPLANNGLPLAASASSDGTQVYVAACDVYTNNDPKQCTSGTVHIIDTSKGGDYQQVPYVNFNTNNSMCTVATAPPCFPDMIALKPQ